MAKKRKEEQSPDTPKRQVKVVYYDDGSTIADMSGTRKNKDKRPKVKSSARDKARTYFSTMKQMLVPMFITLLALTLVTVLFFILAS